MTVSSLLASGWLREDHHLIEVVVVVLLLLILLLLLLVLLRRQRHAEDPEETVPFELETPGAPVPDAPVAAMEAPPPPIRTTVPAPTSALGLPEQLEQHLQSSFERLRVEDQRLDERLAALSAAEAEFTATADERVASLTEWEQRLEARQTQLTTQEAVAEELYRTRELELAQRAADLASRESALARRAADLDAQRPVPATYDLAEREHALEARVASISQREMELARRAAELAVREREVAQAAEQATMPPLRPPMPAARPQAPPEPQPAPPPPDTLPPPPGPPVPAPEGTPPSPPQPEPEPAPPAVEGQGRWNVLALDRLVEQRGSDFPNRVEEWRSYLYSLRAYASADGSLPASFDALIEETFSELVTG